MEKFWDDLLALIFSTIDKPYDRKSCSEVCKQWRRVEGFQRSTLHVLNTDLFADFLPRFPNLLKFQASIPLSNSHMQLLAHTCSRIEVLNLPFKTKEGVCYENMSRDFDDEGLCDIAKGCPNLKTVSLRWRSRIGNRGVISLGMFSKNLRDLDLCCCTNVSDDALKSIGGLNNLEVLNLQGCWLITDAGLNFLAQGSVRNSLKKLDLSECDRITDRGLIYLKSMSCLEGLKLSEAGAEVTDRGCEMGLAEIKTLKKLNLSWLVNVTDEGVIALARNCLNLEQLILMGCELVSGTGIRAFSSHPSLKQIVLTWSDDGVTGYDLIHLVFGCLSLESVILDKRWRMLIPMSVQENVLRWKCQLGWI